MVNMRARFWTALAVVLFHAPAFGQGAEWKTMEYRDLRTKSPTDALQTIIWPREIAEQNDYVVNTLGRKLQGQNASIFALVQSFEFGTKRIEISVLTSRKCDHGANHNASGPERSVCPMKIAVFEGNSGKVISEGLGCFIEPPDSGTGAAHQQNAIQVQFDPSSHAVRMRGLIGGQWVSECTRSFKVPL